MKKVLLAVAAAALGSAILAGGPARADDDKKRYGVLATGFTFCPAFGTAIFPATNVSRRPVRVTVSCVDAAGKEFFSINLEQGPVKAKIEPGKAVTMVSTCEDLVEDLDGDLVRCTVKGRNGDIEGVRGVLHICTLVDDLTACELTEALLFSSDDDD